MTFILVLTVVFPLFYLLVGWLLKKHYSQFPDTFCGYHVGRLAAKNEDTWKTANIYSGKVMIRVSMVGLCIGTLLVFIHAFAADLIDWSDICFAFIMCFAFLSVIIVFGLTEFHLHKLFDRDGYPRQE